MCIFPPIPPPPHSPFLNLNHHWGGLFSPQHGGGGRFTFSSPVCQDTPHPKPWRRPAGIDLMQGLCKDGVAFHEESPLAVWRWEDTKSPVIRAKCWIPLGKETMLFLCVFMCYMLFTMCCVLIFNANCKTLEMYWMWPYPEERYTVHIFINVQYWSCVLVLSSFHILLYSDNISEKI